MHVKSCSLPFSGQRGSTMCLIARAELPAQSGRGAHDERFGRDLGGGARKEGNPGPIQAADPAPLQLKIGGWDGPSLFQAAGART